MISFFMRILTVRNKAAREQVKTCMCHTILGNCYVCHFLYDMQGRTRQTMSFLAPYFYTKWSDYLDTKNKCSTRKKKGKSSITNHPCNWIKESPNDLDKLIIPVNINGCHWILCVSDYSFM